jgi:hypothetical protein
MSTLPRHRLSNSQYSSLHYCTFKNLQYSLTVPDLFVQDSQPCRVPWSGVQLAPFGNHAHDIRWADVHMICGGSLWQPHATIRLLILFATILVLTQMQTHRYLRMPQESGDGFVQIKSPTSKHLTQPLGIRGSMISSRAD